MEQLYPLMLGKPGYLAAKWEHPTENKVEDTQDM